jgi:hypothetical protein
VASLTLRNIGIRVRLQVSITSPQAQVNVAGTMLQATKDGSTADVSVALR